MPCGRLNRSQIPKTSQSKRDSTDVIKLRILRLSWSIHVAQCNRECPYKRQEEGDLLQQRDIKIT